MATRKKSAVEETEKAPAAPEEETGTPALDPDDVIVEVEGGERHSLVGWRERPIVAKAVSVTDRQGHVLAFEDATNRPAEVRVAGLDG